MTRESVAAVLASAAVSARRRLAVTTPQRTRLALPAAATLAREVRHTVDAGAIVATRGGLALVDV